MPKAYYSTVEQPLNSLEVHEVGARKVVAPGTGSEALVPGVTEEQHRPFNQLAQPLAFGDSPFLHGLILGVQLRLCT